MSCVVDVGMLRGSGGKKKQNTHLCRSVVGSEASYDLCKPAGGGMTKCWMLPSSWLGWMTVTGPYRQRVERVGERRGEEERTENKCLLTCINVHTI